jgi:hypothetical protein
VLVAVVDELTAKWFVQKKRAGLTFGLTFGLARGLLVGLVVGLVVGLGVSNVSPRPSVRAPADWLTILRRAGVPEFSVMRHGRWKSASSMRGYIREGSLWSDKGAGRLE